jgi:class 3 adenylate cyclase
MVVVGDALVTEAETSRSISTLVSIVGDSLPSFRDRTSPDGMLTVAFTDLQGSTELMERLGENDWISAIRTYDRIVRASVARRSGDVVKSLGDGVMAAFASASAAQDFAVDLQRALVRYNDEHRREVLLARVGLHTGNVFKAGEDLLGRTVVLAARITGAARGGEILVSAACHDYTRHRSRWTYGEPLELRLKGLTAVELAYPIDWSA